MPEDKPVPVQREHYPEILNSVDLAATAPYESERAINFIDYWHVVVARRWTIFAIVVTVVALTMLITFRQTPIYRAETTIQIDRENPNILSFKDIYEIESLTDDTLQTQYKVLAARTLARRVVEGLKLDESPEFAPQAPTLIDTVLESVKKLLPAESSSTQARTEPDRLRSVIDNYEARLNVTPILKSRLVKVSFLAKDPKLAAEIINEHAKQFNLQNLQFKYDATQEASSFLKEQIAGLKNALEKSEDKLQEYSRANEILFTEEGTNNTASEKLRQLEEEFTKALAERIRAEALATQIKAGFSDALPQMVNNPLLSQLSAQAADLRRQESNLAVTFGAEYPARQRIRSQIEALEKDINSEKQNGVAAVQAQYAAALERERLLSTDLEQQRKLVYNINQQIIQYSILKREVDSNKQIYDGLLTRLKEAGVSAGLHASNIRVVDRAEIPRSPTSPKKGQNFVLSLAGGLIFGLAIAFFQEYLDNTIKSPDDVTRILQVPTLAIIPKLASIMGSRGYRYGYHQYGAAVVNKVTQKIPNGKEDEPKTASVDLIMHSAPTSLLAEAYRSLRTSLLLSSPDHPPRTVLITSSVPSEGKTATALNLAVSLTQTGARTLIIDADMRKPRVHNVFGLENTLGLSSFLTGTATLREVIQQSQVPNLFVIPCGPIPPNPGELILSNRFTRMMEAMREYFDYVIVDSPPLSNVSDGRVLANTCAAVIVVIKACATSRHAIKRAVEHLNDSRSRLAGVVLNDIDVRSRSGDYAYYYKSGYSRSYGVNR
jgi:polysaccharide biosynthesis transport protein